jgi:hypothetical protein
VARDDFRTQARLVSTLPTRELLSWLARTDVLAAPLQLKLTSHGHESVRWALARRADLLRRTQLELVSRGTSTTKRFLSMNPSLSRDAFDLLLPGADEHRLASLALSPALRRDELTSWFDEALELRSGRSDIHRAHSVLASLASRPDLPEPLLRQALDLPSARVTSSALRNAALPRDLASAALLIPEDHLRYVLALNPHLDDDLRERLAADSDSHVRLAALATLPADSSARARRFLDPSFNASDLERLALTPAEAALLVARDDPALDAALTSSLERWPLNLDEHAARTLLERGHRSVLRSPHLSPAERLAGFTAALSLPASLAEPVLLALASCPALETDLALALCTATPSPRLTGALAANTTVPLDARFPVPLLSLRTRYTASAPSPQLTAPPHLDPATWSALLSSWEGSLDDLLASAAELGPAS